MAMRVQRRGDEYCVVPSREELEALHLSDGAEVEVRPVNGGGKGNKPAEHRYATVEEALEAYRRTEHLHGNTYRELAR
jgi:antitoxin component of MazEF toxin-antitoxin module